MLPQRDTCIDMQMDLEMMGVQGCSATPIAGEGVHSPTQRLRVARRTKPVLRPGGAAICVRVGGQLIAARGRRLGPAELVARFMGAAAALFSNVGAWLARLPSCAPSRWVAGLLHGGSTLSPKTSHSQLPLWATVGAGAASP